MDGLLIVLTGFALLGLLDDLLGDRFGLAPSFERGISVMGRAFLSMAGIYCIGITFVQGHTQQIAHLAGVLPFDPSLIIGCLICADSGGLPIAQRIAATPELGIFTGALVAGGFGMTVSYQLPVFLSFLPNKFLPDLMKGFCYGLITLPLGLTVGGLMLHIPFGTLLRNILPILLLCVVLVVGMFWKPAGLIRCLTGFGIAIRVISYVLFAVVVLDVFVPQISLVDMTLVQEACYIAMRQAIMVCGGMVLAHLATVYCRRILLRLSDWMKVNDQSVMGLLLSSVHSMSMIPLYEDMDRRGQIMNAAFSCCGAYVIGGQMAVVAQMVPAEAMPAFMVNKILCGVSAVAVAAIVEGHRMRKAKVQNNVPNA